MGVGYVSYCGSSVGCLSSVLRAASLSTTLVGMSVLMLLEGSYGVLSFCVVDLDFLRLDKDLSPCPPTWDFYLVLVYLRGPVFEPLALKDLRTVTCDVLFLLSLATTKRVDEFQVLSCSFAFRG